jgi:hypothetical protein
MSRNLESRIEKIEKQFQPQKARGHACADLIAKACERVLDGYIPPEKTQEDIARDKLLHEAAVMEITRLKVAGYASDSREVMEAQIEQILVAH